MTEDVASQLAALVPELAADWRVSAGDLDLPYVALGGLASRMVALDGEERDIDWQPVFKEVDRRLVGPAETRNLLIVGFLETLQNVTMNAGRDPRRWAPLLPPHAREGWDALNALHAGRMSPKRFNSFVGHVTFNDAD
jgi:hypothetical protein